jgi:tRNA G18 (ribose-2'-O)-methylase SpoU
VLLAPSRVARFVHAAALTDAGVPVVVAPPEVVAAVVGFDLHRGVLACAERRAHPPTGELLSRARRVALLEGLNDPENLGAIARAARAFGIDGLVIDPTCTDPYSRRTVRVSMGEILSLSVTRVRPDEWPTIVPTVSDAGFEVWAMTPSSDADDLWRLRVPERVAVCLGAEGPGLTARLLDTADRRVRIPIDGAVDSLNVGHAAAVVFAAIGRPPSSGP